MDKVYTSTKKGILLFNRACNNEGEFLYNIYTTYSRNKLKAYQKIRTLYNRDENAHNFRICSHNTNIFTCAYDTIIEPNTYVTLYFTPSNSYMIVHDHLLQ